MSVAVAGPTAVRGLLAARAPAALAPLRLALERRGFLFCNEAPDASSALRIAREKRPDICLLEVDLPGDLDGAISMIRSELPGTAVILLTSSKLDERVFEALRAGATGYVLTSLDPAKVPLAVLGVLAGDPSVSPTVVEGVIEELRELGPRRRLPPGTELTRRESTILALLGEGLTTSDVAERLFITPSTVRCHVAAIVRKLGVQNRKAAARLLQ